MKIEAMATIDPAADMTEFRAAYAKWENHMNVYNEDSPFGLQNGFQTIGWKWAYLATQEESMASAQLGVLMSVSFAAFVLLISTHNIIISIFSTISISFILVSVLCTMEMMGWTFGIIESVAIVIVIGFSVDFVVHLANHYVGTGFSDKYRRAQDSVTELGVSMLSAAVTTFIATIPLFFTTISFCSEFAVLVCLSILYALVFSLGFFTALVLLIGPQGNTGDLKHYIWNPILRWMWSLCAQKPTEKIKIEKVRKFDPNEL